MNCLGGKSKSKKAATKSEFMSRQNPHTKVIGDGSLTGTKYYEVKIILTLREVWGTKSVPDESTIEKEELAPTPGITVEDGDYVLRYSFENRDHKLNKTLIGGRFRPS